LTARLDVEGVIIRQTDRLDWSYIRHPLRPLAELKEAPEIMEELQRRRAECERQSSRFPLGWMTTAGCPQAGGGLIPQAASIATRRTAEQRTAVLDGPGSAWQNVGMNAPRRRLGQSDLWVSPVAFGCWPLAGITSGELSDDTATAVIGAALEAGVNPLDTAHAYGRGGESERRIARALRQRRDQAVVATKVGVYWDQDGALQRTGRPDLLRRHAEESLRRLEADEVDLLYFHAPAEDAPLADSAGLFRQMLAEGKTRAVGVSNLSVEQMQTFVAECPIVACQVRYNRLQREIEAEILPWCRERNVSVVAYEPLALGLLAGKFRRE
jgi:diketogulonate reductase-like aldo/keto reductase